LDCFTFSGRPVISALFFNRKLPSVAWTSVTLPVVYLPGLTCSPRLYAEQIPALWRFGPVTVADHRRDDSMAAIARRISTAFRARWLIDGRIHRF